MIVYVRYLESVYIDASRVPDGVYYSLEKAQLGLEEFCDARIEWSEEYIGGPKAWEGKLFFRSVENDDYDEEADNMESYHIREFEVE